MGPSGDMSSIKILHHLEELESRISRLEKHLDLEPAQKRRKDNLPATPVSNLIESTDTLEFQIGQYWFAKVGIVVLAIGIAFLLTFPYENLPSALPSFFGYVLVSGILILSHYWRKIFPHISQYLLGGGLILLYFTTLRLYFFSEQPALTNKLLELVLLMLVVVINLIIAARKHSVFLTSLSLTLGYITAIVYDHSFVIFTIISIMSVTAVFFRIRNNWTNVFIYAIVLSFFTHFLWFLNNPFMGHQIQLVAAPPENLIFFLLYTSIFAMGNLLRSKPETEDNTLIISTFLISLGSYGFYLLLTLTKFQSNMAGYHLMASMLFLILAIIFWSRERSKYSTFFYAIAGYTALSVAIITGFNQPDYFIWLCWQSIIVITTAIWFRSKFIILANFIIFLSIFFAYLILAGKVSTVSISFGIVAIISARILNWQKHRLELKTELMRNAYLTSAFFIFPYALYHIVPRGYVILSWILVTLFYYVLSVLLRNIKYRWMALMTLILTVLYVFIIGIIQLEPIFRIISFLVLGTVLVIVSLVYTRIRSNKQSSEL